MKDETINAHIGKMPDVPAEPAIDADANQAVTIRFDALMGFPGGSFKPSVQCQFKTLYQSTLEACLSSAAIAFANRNYTEVFDENDLILKAAQMTESILDLTAQRVRHAIEKGDVVKFNPNLKRPAALVDHSALEAAHTELQDAANDVVNWWADDESDFHSGRALFDRLEAAIAKRTTPKHELKVELDVPTSVVTDDNQMYDDDVPDTFAGII